MSPYSLSICVPTYNRGDRTLQLLGKFLSHDGPFEICVHDDGSSDGTYDRLLALAELDPRVKPSSAQNQGRAAALRQSVLRAEGKYVMLFDDDDDIFIEGFDRILCDCKVDTPDDICGFIYQMSINGTPPLQFPVNRANLISLRADFGVSGDKKEVIKTAILKPIVETQPRTRRVPTSLYWTKVSLYYDVICQNQAVGNKVYLVDGMTGKISKLKAKSPQPMMLLYRYRIQAFFMGRYRSIRFLLRSCAGLVRYALRTFYLNLTKS